MDVLVLYLIIGCVFLLGFLTSSAMNRGKIEDLEMDFVELWAKYEKQAHDDEIRRLDGEGSRLSEEYMTLREREERWG